MLVERAEKFAFQACTAFSSAARTSGVRLNCWAAAATGALACAGAAMGAGTDVGAGKLTACWTSAGFAA